MLGTVRLGVLVVVCAGFGLAGCGDDDVTPGTDSGVGADAGGGVMDGGGGGGDAGPQDGGGGTLDGSTPVDAGGGGDAGNPGDSGPLGCANGGPTCGKGLMCCSGVPYPSEGVCMASCPAVSDRARKEAVTPVDADAILTQLATLPIAEWSYRGERSVRHVGPMAQDFHAAFGLGESDKTIHPIDESGITMAAVQALYRRVGELERRNRTLADDNAALGRRLRAVERRRR